MSFVLRVCLALGLVVLQACGGGGGSGGGSVNSQAALTPYPVLPSSFENKASLSLPIELTQLPKLSTVMGGSIPLGLDSVGESIAVADFKQNGTFLAFVVVSNLTNNAKALFVGLNSTGGYEIVDLFNDPNIDQVACPTPKQSLVADLNGDSRPDVYLVCAGSGGVPTIEQYVYLSMNSGKFQLKTTLTIVSSPTSLNATSASIADINGDGCKDVVTNDSGALRLMLATSCSAGQYTLLDYADTQNTTRLPSVGYGDPPSNVQGVFFIPRSGPRYDLIVAGQGNQGNPVKWYYNHGSGYFKPVLGLLGFDVRGYSILPQYASTQYDYLEAGSYGYVYITNSQNFERLVRITKPDLQSGLVLTPEYYRPVDWINPVNNWPSFLRLFADSNLRPYDAGCEATTSRCTKIFPSVTVYSTTWP